MPSTRSPAGDWRRVQQPRRTVLVRTGPCTAPGRRCSLDGEQGARRSGGTDAGVGPSGTACCLSERVTCKQRLGGGREGGAGQVLGRHTTASRPRFLCEPENRASRSGPDGSHHSLSASGYRFLNTSEMTDAAAPLLPSGHTRLSCRAQLDLPHEFAACRSRATHHTREGLRDRPSWVSHGDTPAKVPTRCREECRNAQLRNPAPSELINRFTAPLEFRASDGQVTRVSLWLLQELGRRGPTEEARGRAGPAWV